MTKMRAKMRVTFVTTTTNGPDGPVLYERLGMCAVAASKYPVDGSDEDNTYAKFSPDANFSITIANPELFGKFKVDEKYYIDFTEAE